MERIIILKKNSVKLKSSYACTLGIILLRHNTLKSYHRWPLKHIKHFFLCFETINIRTSSLTQTFHTHKNINTWEQNLKTQFYELLLKIPSHIDHLFSKEMC